MATISAILTSHNEERKIENALKSVQWANEIILVDGESTDSTVQIARKHTTQIISTPNDPGMMSMRNIGIKSASDAGLPASGTDSSASSAKGGFGGWILILDSDEVIPPQLAQEIRQHVNSNEHYVAYRFPRKGFFLGKWIKHCGWYPDYQIRLFKKGHGLYKNEQIHEQVTITSGKIGQIDTPFEHYSSYDFKEYLYKVHRYIRFEANKLAQQEKPPSPINYLFLRPVARFLSIYIRQKGILDGWKGFVLSFFAGYHELMSYIRYLANTKRANSSSSSAGAD